MGLFNEVGRQVEKFKQTAKNAAKSAETYQCPACGEKFDSTHEQCPECAEKRWLGQQRRKISCPLSGSVEILFFRHNTV